MNKASDAAALAEALIACESVTPARGAVFDALEAMLVEDDGETVLRAGDVTAWPKGVRNAHHLQNRGREDCVFVAISAGDSANDHGEYPDIDLRFVGRDYFHKDGTPYQPKG